jgi:lysophospholipase L1-like esterase
MTKMLAVLVLAPFALQQEPSDQPVPRKKEYPWMSTAVWNQMHEGFLKRAKAGKVDLLFLGDSITQGWGDNAVWKKHYGGRNAVNFGIGGDTTQNLLWRITHGELEGIAPKAVVLMIGTNNFGLHNDGPDAVVKGNAAILKVLAEKLPRSKVLLLGLFPRDEKSGTDFRKRIETANQGLELLASQLKIPFLDLAPKFLQADGTLPKEIMPDFLHLSEKGYQIWADAMEPVLKVLLK